MNVRVFNFKLCKDQLKHWRNVNQDTEYAYGYGYGCDYDYDFDDSNDQVDEEEDLQVELNAIIDIVKATVNPKSTRENLQAAFLFLGEFSKAIEEYQKKYDKEDMTVFSKISKVGWQIVRLDASYPQWT
jgi:hypothetical protein